MADGSSQNSFVEFWKKIGKKALLVISVLLAVIVLDFLLAKFFDVHVVNWLQEIVVMLNNIIDKIQGWVYNLLSGTNS